MPTYHYKCPECKHEFQQSQSISADPIELCPECGGKPERVISGGAGFLFKGSGFYITDYRSSSYKESAKADQSKSSSGSESKSTSKDGGGSGSSAGASDKSSASPSKSGSTTPTKKESK